MVCGLADRSGYAFTVSGDTEVGRCLQLARTIGLRSLRATAEGTAQMNLQIAGSWAAGNGLAGFASPQITGSAKLRNVRFNLRAGSQLVEVASAEMQRCSRRKVKCESSWECVERISPAAARLWTSGDLPSSVPTQHGPVLTKRRQDVVQSESEKSALVSSPDKCTARSIVSDACLGLGALARGPSRNAWSSGFKGVGEHQP